MKELEEYRIFGTALGIPHEVGKKKYVELGSVILPHAAFELWVGGLCSINGVLYVDGGIGCFDCVRKRNDKFVAECGVYCDLRRNGLWVMDGLKYGCTFVGYTSHPRECHSVCAVEVVNGGSCICPRMIVGLSRLCSGVKKQLVLAWVGPSDGCEASSSTSSPSSPLSSLPPSSSSSSSTSSLSSSLLCPCIHYLEVKWLDLSGSS